MTEPGSGPLIPRRRLGASFRALREARDETLLQTAAAVMFSPSKLSRIENGQAGEPHPRDVRDLIAHFAPESDRVDRLNALADASRRPGWWQVPPYDMPSRLDTHISYESAAVRMEIYSPIAVPGLLQTPEYARAVITRAAPHLSAEDVDLQVRIRMARQERLAERAAPPHQWYVVPETVLHRQVGDRRTMGHQLTVLLESMDRPDVELYLIPFSAGIYEAVELTTVTIFRFSDPTDDDVVAIERVRHTDFSDKTQTITKYQKSLAQLEEYWLGADASRTFIERVRQEKWMAR